MQTALLPRPASQPAPSTSEYQGCSRNHSCCQPEYSRPASFLRCSAARSRPHPVCRLRRCRRSCQTLPHGLAPYHRHPSHIWSGRSSHHSPPPKMSLQSKTNCSESVLFRTVDCKRIKAFSFQLLHFCSFVSLSGIPVLLHKNRQKPDSVRLVFCLFYYAIH